jgi:DNA-binding response OmpR family regulator
MRVHHEGRLAALLQQWPAQPADLLIAALHEADLTAAVAQIRSVTAAPLIVIVNPLQEDQQVTLLKLGVDLIVTRPYSTRVLLAYTQNLAQRGRALPLTHLPQLHIGNFEIDPLTRTVKLDQATTVALTAREFQLFYLLYTHTGQLLTTDQLIEKVWGWCNPAESNSLRTLISRLRTKLHAGPHGPLQIDNVAGTGYTMILYAPVQILIS